MPFDISESALRQNFCELVPSVDAFDLDVWGPN